MFSGTFDPQTFRKWLIRSSPVKNKGVNEKKNKLTSMEARQFETMTGSPSELLIGVKCRVTSAAKNHMLQ